MKIRNLTYLIVALLATGLLWGCGSSGSGGTDVSDPDGEFMVETLGITNCVKCHSAATPETLSWLESAHGNSNGSMRYGDPRGPHDESSSCQPCHNQLLDGDKLDDAFTDIIIGQTSGGDDVLANGERDIVTCESCHGGGGAHRGIGPIPYARPDWQQCVACHDHPEGVRHADDHGMLASNVGASAHNNSDDLHASTTRCQRCHTVEGAVQLAQFTGDSDVMHLMDDLDPIDLEENLHAVTCSACHIPHNDAGRWESFLVNNNSLATGNWDPNGNGVADEFDFCTSCHTYYNQDGVLIGSGSAASGTAPFYHNTAWYRTVTSTHYDDPATGYGLEESLVEGYVIRENSENPCFDCHGHELRTNTRRSRDVAEEGDNAADYGSTIHTQWASSGHAGGILNAKYAAADSNPISGSRGTPEYEATGTAQLDAVMAAGASDDTSGGGFTHYDWDATNRQSCQMCHTATGFVNYTSDPGNYAAANNDFSHLAGWAENGNSGQNELLYCWGCHDNAGTGTLRVNEQVTADYTYGGESIVFPDSGASNTCFVCHAGRGNNETASTSSRFAGHHGPAAGIIFAELTHMAYEYPGLSYAPQPYFGHDVIEADGPGLCVACHMNSDEANHTFAVVDKNDTGDITAINGEGCVSCHDGEHALFVAQNQVGQSLNIWNGTAAVPTVVTQQMADDSVAVLEEESKGYQEAGLLLLDIINQENGMSNYTAATINQNNILENDRGAFQNAKIPTEDPGGYAHNRFYVKRALFDAIDWAEDGVLDGSITDYSAYPDAMHWLGTTRP